LILLLTVDGILPYPIASVGFLTFLLSRARAAWLGWLLGMIAFIPSLKANIQMRITVSLLIATLLIIPLASIEPFSTTISSRLESFSSIENDRSLEERSEGYSESLDEALSQFLGKGMGTKENALGNDSGIMKILFSLGWFGTLPYLGGVLLLLMTVFQSFQKRFDAFISAAFSIAFGVFAQIGFNPIMEASIGMIFWGFLGIGMAGHKYHSYHNKL
ncbi:MAG: O-antigen ligase domain-containing protein, partial [Cyanobacteria bacterium J06592_8]